MSDGRFPSTVYTHGTEPDPRFSLANERTFLAWISTGLALLSVGVGLESLALNLQPDARLAASVVLIVGGLACPTEAWFGWVRVERALRHQRPLPASHMMWLLPAIIAVAGVLILLGLVLR